MNTPAILNTVWDYASTILVVMLPFVVAYLGDKAAALLKINAETELYQSLYRTIDNVLRALLISRGGGMTMSSGPLVQQAIDLVKQNNPKAVSKLEQSDDALRTKVLAKIPDAQKVVESLAGKVAG